MTVENQHNATTEPAVREPEDRITETHHTVVVNGQELRYTATAGTMILREEAEGRDKESEGEKPRASVFFIAYTLASPEHVDHSAYRSDRPVTFSFNGGPGSSSVWLHLGLLGPRRVLAVDEHDKPQAPPYSLVDNEHTLLDATDLVFIDPVSTGFSRAVPGEKAAQFHDFQNDIESVGDFIRLYSTRYRRWSSPKYLAGESYGTTRAAGLSGYLQNRHGMYLNGIILISTILNFQTARFTPGNDLPYILFLPTYTATARYHQRLPNELQADLGRTLTEAERFALEEYAPALMKGSSLPAKDRGEISSKVARLTGLSSEYVRQTNLRINIHRFVKELLRHERRTVGRLDSRFTGMDRDAAGEKSDFDPSYALIQGPFTAMLNDYVRTELEFENDLAYEILTDQVHPWSYDDHQNQYVNAAETLREAMCKNPALRVFVASGYYDLATPYWAAQYTFNHLGIDEDLQNNIIMKHYEAGHMMYIHHSSLRQLKADLGDFVNNIRHQ